ncbi:MAG: colanic acid biosynthesis glycosyltransferase WcaL [Desulfobacteraceae bacterium]|nr:MAG: colanic acid biosynthesis glycosyltransferase WcaL [Desulfobacteraceae bacterium]
MIRAPLPVLGMVLKGYPRISETFISNELLLLEELGFPLHLFSMRRPRENFCHPSVKKIRAKVDYLPETLLASLPRLLHHNAKLAGKRPGFYRQALGTAVRRFARTRRSATLKHFLQAGYLVECLMDRSGSDPQVVHLHAHFAHSPASVAMFAARLSGLPFSFTAHAKDIYTSDPRQLAEKIALAQFAVTCTNYNRSYLNALAGDSSRFSPYSSIGPVQTPIYRVYHGIDPALFSGGAARIGTKPPFRILTVARLTRKKGIPTVLKAIRHLADAGISIRYTLIGDGEERKKTLSMIRELRLENSTRWLGTQPHDVVLKHYRSADLFVLGSEVATDGDRDGIPNVLLESMAMGVPVAATRISAIPEAIEDGKTGLLVPPGEPEALARSMKRLLTEGALREKVIRNARDSVIAHFDNRILVRRLAAIFKEKIPAFQKLAIQS